MQNTPNSLCHCIRRRSIEPFPLVIDSLSTRDTRNSSEKWLRLKFGFLSSRHEVRREYLIYDTDAFIADVGGFLGLLLGYSAFGLLEKVTSWVKSGD